MVAYLTRLTCFFCEGGPKTRLVHGMEEKKVIAKKKKKRF